MNGMLGKQVIFGVCILLAACVIDTRQFVGNQSLMKEGSVVLGGTAPTSGQGRAQGQSEVLSRSFRSMTAARSIADAELVWTQLNGDPILFESEDELIIANSYDQKYLAESVFVRSEYELVKDMLRERTALLEGVYDFYFKDDVLKIAYNRDASMAQYHLMSKHINLLPFSATEEYALMMLEHLEASVEASVSADIHFNRKMFQVGHAVNAKSQADAIDHTIRHLQNESRFLYSAHFLNSVIERFGDKDFSFIMSPSARELEAYRFFKKLERTPEITQKIVEMIKTQSSGVGPFGAIDLYSDQIKQSTEASLHQLREYSFDLYLKEIGTGHKMILIPNQKITLSNRSVGTDLLYGLQISVVEKEDLKDYFSSQVAVPEQGDLLILNKQIDEQEGKEWFAKTTRLLKRLENQRNQRNEMFVRHFHTTTDVLRLTTGLESKPLDTLLQ